jgi:RNA polymerase sigma-70 factor, ECF subfamily
LENELIHIVKGCQNNDRVMQRQLYDYCYNNMLKLCLRYTKDFDKAAIVYNDAMLKVFKSIKQYNEEGKVLSWIKSITVNTAIDYIRVKANMQTYAAIENLSNDLEDEVDILRKMDGVVIRNLINSLPDKLSVVFNLFVYEEYQHNEIAALLQIPEGTCRYYLSEARKQLKQKLANNIFSLNKNVINE